MHVINTCNGMFAGVLVLFSFGKHHVCRGGGGGLVLFFSGSAVFFSVLSFFRLFFFFFWWVGGKTLREYSCEDVTGLRETSRILSLPISLTTFSILHFGLSMKQASAQPVIPNKKKTSGSGDFVSHMLKTPSWNRGVFLGFANGTPKQNTRLPAQGSSNGKAPEP